MGKIADAIAKTKGTAVQDPARHEKRIIRGSDRNATKRARSTLLVNPARLEVDAEALVANRIINAESRKEVIASYKMLRTRLLHVMRPNDWRKVAVTSPLQGDGKTVTAINLAIVLAQEGSRNVFLIDFDLRCPSVSSYLGIDDDDRSIARVYTEGADISELLTTIGQDGLFVLGNSGPGIENSSELLSSQDTEALLVALQSLDPDGIFIFDLPPVLPTDDALVLAPLLDAALVVVSEGRTKRENIAKTFDLLNESDVELAGVVLNRASEGNIDAYY